MKKKRLYVKNKKLYVLIFGLEFSVIGILSWSIMLVIAVTPEKTVIVYPIIESEMVFDRTPFSEWIFSDQVYNDLEFNDGEISLSDSGYERQKKDIQIGRSVRDPQGYIESPKTISENVYICTKVLSHTSEIDYSLRLNHKFQVIHGDGDDRSIALKQISKDSPNGDYIIPNVGEEDIHVDKLNRFRLEKNLPVDKEFTSCLTIFAPPGDIQKTVNVELHILDNDGKEMDLGPMPSWKVIDDSQQNGRNTFAIGLIDSRAVHPALELRGYCAVEMNDIGSEPSERERKACIHP